MIPQKALDAKQAECLKTRKPVDVPVINMRGQGTLIMRFRYTASGVVGTWQIRYKEGDTRPTVPLGNYCREDRLGMSRDTAARQFEGWVAKRLAGTMLAKPSYKTQAKLVERERLRPVMESETLGALVETWLDDYLRKNAVPSSVATIESALRAHLKPHWGMRASEFNAKLLGAIVADLERQGVKSQADRVRTYARNIFNAASTAKRTGLDQRKAPASLARFDILDHDLGDVEAVKGAKGRRKKPMQPQQLAAIYKVLDGMDADGRCRNPRDTPVIHLMLRLVLLTGATRFAQVARLCDKDIDLGKGLLHLHDIKGGRRRDYAMPLVGELALVAAALKPHLKAKPSRTPIVLLQALRVAMSRAGVNTTWPGEHQARDVRSTVATWFNRRAVGVRREANNFIQSHGLGSVEDEHYIEADLEEVKDALSKLETLLLDPDNALGVDKPLQLAA